MNIQTHFASPIYVGTIDGGAAVSDLWTNWAVPESKLCGFYQLDAPLPKTQAGLLNDLHRCVYEVLVERCLSLSPMCGHLHDSGDSDEYLAKAQLIADALFNLPPSKSSRRPVELLVEPRRTRVENDPAAVYNPKDDMLDAQRFPDSIAGLLRYMHEACEEWVTEIGSYRRDLNRGKIEEANKSRVMAVGHLDYVSEAMRRIRELAGNGMAELMAA
jgi:hypothetical protein